MAWVEGYTTAQTFVQDLVNLLVANGWTLVDDISADEKVVSTTITEGTQSLTMYLRIKRDTTPPASLRSCKFQLAEAWDSTAHTGTNVSPEARLNWYDADVSSPGLRDVSPIQYWGSINANRVAMCFMGDPTLDYQSYCISFLYAGRVVRFQEGILDVTGNFALTVGTDLGSGETVPAPSTYGIYTANGVTDIMMYKTKNGALYQRHYPAFITQMSTMLKDERGFNPSQWTSKFHLSPIYVVHGYDGYRGYLEDVVALDQQNIVHLDELVVSVSGVGEERYKYFQIKSSHNFIKTSSANPNYGIAVKKV